MSKNYLNVIFLCSNTIGQPQSLEMLLDAIQALNYKIEVLQVGDLVTERFAFWRNYDEQTRQQLDIAYNKHHLSFGPTENLTGSSIVLTFNVRWITDESKPVGGIAWPWDRWEVKGSGCTNIVEAHTSDTAMFTQKQWNPEENAGRLLDL